VRTCRGGAGALQPVNFVVLENGELAVLAHPASKLGLRGLRRIRELVPPALWLVKRPVCLHSKSQDGCSVRRLVMVLDADLLVLLCTFWHLAEQKNADRHRLHRSRPLVLPQLLQSAGGGASVECIFDVCQATLQRP